MQLCTLSAITVIAAASLVQDVTPQEAFQRDIRIERHAEMSEIAFDWRLDKIFIAAEVNGQSGDFIFDTGSPTIVSRTLADRLDLRIIGRTPDGTPMAPMW